MEGTKFVKRAYICRKLGDYFGTDSTERKLMLGNNIKTAAHRLKTSHIKAAGKMHTETVTGLEISTL